MNFCESFSTLNLTKCTLGVIKWGSLSFTHCRELYFKFYITDDWAHYQSSYT